MQEFTAKDLSFYELWVRENPSSRLFYEVALAYRANQQHQKAIEILKFALPYHPEFFNARVLLVDLYQEKGLDALARQESLEILKLIINIGPVIQTLSKVFSGQEQKILEKLHENIKELAGNKALVQNDGKPIEPEMKLVLHKLEALGRAALTRAKH